MLLSYGSPRYFLYSEFLIKEKRIKIMSFLDFICHENRQMSVKIYFNYERGSSVERTRNLTMISYQPLLIRRYVFESAKLVFNWSHQIKIRNGYIYMGSFNLSVMSLFYGLFKSDILLHLAKSINHFLEYLETDSVPDSLRKYSPFSQSLVTLVYD